MQRLEQSVANCELQRACVTLPNGTSSDCSSIAALLDPLCSFLAPFLRGSSLLAFPNFWSLHCTVSFTLTASRTALSGTHCLPPRPSEIGMEAFSISNSYILYAPKISTRWMMPTEVVASILAVRIECLDCWAFWIQIWKNFLCYHHSGTWCSVAFSLEQSLSLLQFWDCKDSKFAAFCDAFRPSFLFFCCFSKVNISSALSFQSTALLELPIWPNSMF